MAILLALRGKLLILGFRVCRYWYSIHPDFILGEVEYYIVLATKCSAEDEVVSVDIDDVKVLDVVYGTDLNPRSRTIMYGGATALRPQLQVDWLSQIYSVRSRQVCDFWHDGVRGTSCVKQGVCLDAIHVYLRAQRPVGLWDRWCGVLGSRRAMPPSSCAMEEWFLMR